MTVSRFFVATAAAGIAAGVSASPLSLSSYDALAESGLAATTVDVQNLINEAVADRQKDPHYRLRSDGGALWLAASGEHAASEKIIARDGDTAGYRARAYAVSLGADIKYQDLLFGVSYNWAHSDTDTRGRDRNLDSEADYYGLTLFASYIPTDTLHLNARAGWMHLRGNSDLPAGGETSVSGDVWNASVGLSSNISLGEITLTPYADAQASLIIPENFRGGEPDNALLWQFPVGLKIGARYRLSSFTVEPSLDLSLVARAGDKKVTTRINNAFESTRYTESVIYRSALSVKIAGEHAGLLLRYRYSAGEHGRDNHTFTVDGNYLF